MIRKHVSTAVFVVLGAMLLAGIAAQVFSGHAMAQAGQPGAALAPAVDVGGACTYQGSLQQNGAAFDGSCDIEFRLFDAATAGAQVGAAQTNNGQAVSKGRFKAVLDFGTNALNGQARWLGIAARCPSGSGGFTTLSPRQPLTAAPYALSLQPGAAVAGSAGQGQNAAAEILNLTNNGTGPGPTVNSATRGVHVASGSMAGMQVDQADLGVFVANARDGLLVETARENGVQVNTAVNGMRVLSATGNGVQVDSAGVGVWVESTIGGGIFVRSAGTVGLQGQASLNSVQIDNATGIGLAAGSAANGMVVNSATSWAGFFNGPISANTCTGCLLATFGVNTGTSALAPGDIVAIRGTRPGDTTSQPMLMEVGPAGAGDPVVGVVYGRGELVADALTSIGETKQLLAPREGAAEPGDYVQIIIYGPVQVKASALRKTIAMGDKLAIDNSGAARALQTVEVGRVQLAESAPTIGIALEGLAASKNGLIWVLVNPK